MNSDQQAIYREIVEGYVGVDEALSIGYYKAQKIHILNA